MGSRPTVVADLDGTLLDLTGIRAWARGERTDYDVFHGMAAEAPAIAWTVSAVQALWDQGFEIVVMTARAASHYESTAAWLAKNNVPYSKLVMRPRGDQFSDLVVKTSLVSSLKTQGHDIVLAFEDNPDLVKLWTAWGIPCIVVPGFDEE